MPIITITTADADTAIDVWADCAHRYGIDAVYLVNGDGHFEPEPEPDDENVATYVEADPTPPHGIERDPRGRRATPLNITNTVDCPHPGCPGRPGQWCGSPNGTSYGNTFIHAARKAAWNGRR